jgi:hypothetical protein
MKGTFFAFRHFPGIEPKGVNMPILLWLLGIPIPLIILFLLLH